MVHPHVQNCGLISGRCVVQDSRQMAPLKDDQTFLWSAMPKWIEIALDRPRK